MSNISGKLNMLQLKSKVVEKNGEKFIILPVKENNFFVGDKGIYFDFMGFEIKNKKEGQKDTHLVKQSMPKDVYEKMSDEEKKAQPILGNLILWGGGSHSEPEPQSSDSANTLEVNDLPWD